MPSVKALQCFHFPPTFKFTTKPQLWLHLKFTKSDPSGHLSTGCPQLTPWSASPCPPPSSSSPWTGTWYSHIWNENCGKILKYKSDSLPGFIDSKCKILQIQHHNANSIQIQYNYKANKRQIQYKYNANTIQIQGKYKTNTMHIPNRYEYPFLLWVAIAISWCTLVCCR